MSGTVFLDVASDIGRRLCADAIWHEDRCTWVGAQNDEGPTGEPVVQFVTLGPDLYGGTSGVALFLAHLYAVTGGPDVRRTAMGAARHALARTDDLPPDSWAAYAGRSGPLLAAAVVGLSTGGDDLVECVQKRLRDGGDSAGRADAEDFDVISGHAGAVLGLLTLGALLKDGALVEAAARRGHSLVAGASRAGGEWSWASSGSPQSPHLTGYSHGTAGVAHAMLELRAAGGPASWLDVAEAAFAYERRLFDPGRGNWPDFRSARASGRRSRSPGPGWVTMWCHGAPGIALSRLRAVELFDDEDCRREAVVAVETTRRNVLAWLPTASNYSLCHGLAGNAEVLLCAHEVLGASEEASCQVALEVAERGIDRYAPDGRWPCGTTEGMTPNLLLGLAGIGLFYLRLHDPSIPSVLLLRPEAYRRLAVRHPAVDFGRIYTSEVQIRPKS
ncbi:MAG TPA: lanthionine synthetase LanC family protein [Acidimicrobiales bacterium]|nr:lanthionine synthetase LanC family protein [Acidimicrobiales bacterium]